MNSLSEFKALLEAHGVVVTKSVGYQFNVRKDVWSMFDGNYYCNNVIVKPKEKLQEYLKAPKEKKHGRAKSIQAGKR